MQEVEAGMRAQAMDAEAQQTEAALAAVVDQMARERNGEVHSLLHFQHARSHNSVPTFAIVLCKCLDRCGNRHSFVIMCKQPLMLRGVTICVHDPVSARTCGYNVSVPTPAS